MKKYNLEQMKRDILSVEKIPANEDMYEEEALLINVSTLSRTEEFYLTKEKFYLKNVFFPEYFNFKKITWKFLNELIK